MIKKEQMENGRSMVEILGVLAIIGVLTIGGISGFTVAANMGRAAAVGSDVGAMYAGALGRDKAVKDSYTPEDFQLKTLYPMTVSKGTHVCGGGNICIWEVTVTGVPQAVCRHVVGLLPTIGTSASACADAENDLTVGFDDKGDYATVN